MREKSLKTKLKKKEKEEGVSKCTVLKSDPPALRTGNDATKSHTPNHESLFQSRQRDGQHTDLLAWSSLRREPDESMMSGTRAATAALKMAIFRPLFSTLPLRCEGKRLICLSFVLKLVSRQQMILGWSSPLNWPVENCAVLERHSYRYLGAF